MPGALRVANFTVSRYIMKYWPLWAVLVIAALAAGCRKHEPAAATTPTNSASADAATPADEAPTRGPGIAPPPTAVTVPDTGDTKATLSQLSLELRKYVLRTKSAPSSFEDFVAKSQVQAPPPPAGKKYALQSGAVVLVNR